MSKTKKLFFFFLNWKKCYLESGVVLKIVVKKHQTSLQNLQQICLKKMGENMAGTYSNNLNILAGNVVLPYLW